MPTSPVYLVKRGRPAEAAKALARLHNLKDESVIRARLAVVQHTVAMEQEATATLGAATVMDLFRNPIDRRRTLLTVGVWTCFNMAGAAFLGNGLYFLQQQVSVRRLSSLVKRVLILHDISFPGPGHYHRYQDHAWHARTQWFDQRSRRILSRTIRKAFLLRVLQVSRSRSEQ